MKDEVSETSISIQDLPDEIIIKILSKTTSKDLGRCHCVSKQWKDYFTVEAFKLRHSNSSSTIDNNVDSIITVLSTPSRTSSNQFEALTFKIPNKHDKNENKTSSRTQGKLNTLPNTLSKKFDHCSNIYDGLTCIYNQWLDSISDLSVVVYSTRTNEWLVLPTSTNYDNLSNVKKQLRQTCFIGLDTIRNEYKIVKITTSTRYYNLHSKTSRTKYETLVLGSRCWNRLEAGKVPLSLYLGWPCFFGHGVYLDGVIYWMHYYERSGSSYARTQTVAAFDWMHYYERSGSSYARTQTVAAFDFSNEEFRAFNLDKILTESSFDCRPGPDKCYLAAVRGRLTAYVLRQSHQGHDEVLVCTFSDRETTFVAWIRTTISNGSFSPYNSVSQISRLIVRHETGSRIMDEDVLFSCKDLENGISFVIQVKF